MPVKLDLIEHLHGVPASDVKKRGWRGIMRTLRERGIVLVTNHDQPDAVIIGPEAYAGLVDIAARAESEAASKLDALRLRFDKRLAGLQTPDAGTRLRSVMHGRARLRGRVKAGTRD